MMKHLLQFSLKAAFSQMMVALILLSVSVCYSGQHCNAKTTPTMIGGSHIDTDGDGVPDCDDPCPADALDLCPLNGVLELNGSDEKFRVENDSPTLTSEIRAIEFWLNPVATFNGNHPSVPIFNINTNSSRGLSIHDSGDDVQGEVIRLRTGSGNNTILMYEDLGDDWVHVAIIGNGTEYDRILINGELVSSTGTATYMDVNKITVGFNATDGSHYNGRIDELRFWSIDRTEDDIFDYYNKELQPCDLTGLWAYCQFDEDSDDVTSEITANSTSVTSVEIDQTNFYFDYYGLLTDYGGCTDATACNYNELACVDDGSCDYTQNFYISNNPNAPLAQGCTPPPGFQEMNDCCLEYVFGLTGCSPTFWSEFCWGQYVECVQMSQGCTDEAACNYVEGACVDDGSCVYPQWYISQITGNPELSCTPISGGVLAVECCIELIGPDYYNQVNGWDSDWAEVYADCISSAGCTNPLACNYTPYVCEDDSSCQILSGCIDEDACNYNEFACVQGMPCISPDFCEFCTGETDGTGEAILVDQDLNGICDLFDVPGCMNIEACNYNENATQPVTLSCVFAEYCEFCSGETDGTGTAIFIDQDENGICDNEDIIGCGDPAACNYNVNVTSPTVSSCVFAEYCESCSGEVDGSGVAVFIDENLNGICDLDDVEGCDDPLSCNYNVNTTVPNASLCAYADYCEVCSGETDGTGLVLLIDENENALCDLDEVQGCKDPLACNYFVWASFSTPEICEYPGYCEVCSNHIDGTGFAFLLDANNNGICDADEVEGCLDPNACTYDSTATLAGGGCLYSAFCDECVGLSGGVMVNNLIDEDNNGICDLDEGCIDSTACNYDELVSWDDGSCVFGPDGCTDPLATNYDSMANCDDGSCLFDSCPGDANGDGSITAADLTSFLIEFGSTCTPLEPCIFDFDANDIITSSDLTVFLTLFGTVCG